ncbi:unnamed protein product [Linum tenue]|uniref:Uncharacterized protein n=1 Tax=Linum tenue TaxID=586396 RepID=A0AAV0LEJ2_9ROSI|nr:unnamed protein product [Linum tenue]
MPSFSMPQPIGLNNFALGEQPFSLPQATGFNNFAAEPQRGSVPNLSYMNMMSNTSPSPMGLLNQNALPQSYPENSVWPFLYANQTSETGNGT